MIAATPPPPYYAVIFSSVKTGKDSGYHDTSDRMIELAGKQPGYLGYESAGTDFGITVSYWRDLASVRGWKQQADHLVAQKMGMTDWYEQYQVRICLVERDYGWGK